MILLPAATVLEVFTVSVLIMDEPPLVAPLRRVPWVNCIHEQLFILGFVFDEILELAEDSFRVPLRERQVFADVFEVLQCDASAVIVKGFVNNLLRYW